MRGIAAIGHDPQRHSGKKAQRLKIFPPLRLVTCNPLIRQLESPRLGLVKVT
jgi:hypothetical protein